jgi:hypothetical protein
LSGAVVAAVCVFALAAPGGAAAAACADEFTGPSGGSWAVASNWSNGVPGPASVVCWGQSTTVVVDEGAQSAESIAGGGALVVRDAGKLNLGAASSALSGAVQTGGGGTLELHGRLACAQAALAGGEIDADGALECPLTIGGGRLLGVGSVTSVVNNGGTVEPGDGGQEGGLHVSSYSQGPGGTLSVRQETSAGGLTDHLLDATGSVSLGGTVLLAPSSPPAGFLVLDSASEPQGYFTHVTAPVPGSPWTIAYGPHGALAVSGGSVPVEPRITGSLEAGGTVSCGLPGAGSAAVWQPRGEVAYAWNGPFFYPIAKPVGLGVGAGASPPSLLAEELDPELDAAKTATIAVPANAVGFRIACSIRYWMPAGGSQPSVTQGGESPPTLVAGPYRSVVAPAIAGRPVPGGRVTCSPGRWEGTPGSITYRWLDGRRGSGEAAIWTGVGTGAGQTVRDGEGGTTLACIVTAHYGGLLVPAEASVEVPAAPQPVLCARRALTLVSARTAVGALLVFGAAQQRYFGRRVVLLRRAPGAHRWRPVATGRVNASGYFELRLRPRGRQAAGALRAVIGRTVSNTLRVPGVLQIASAHTKPGESLVDLRLGAAARRSARVTVSPVEEDCSPGPAIAAATLAPGADLRVRLTVARGALPAYYIARAAYAGKAASVELVVPALPSLLPG